MNIRKPYKGIPVGFSDGVTNTEIGPIYDLYFVNANGSTTPIGRIGKNEDLDLWYATPILYSPFTNTAMRFSGRDGRKNAAVFLLGIYYAGQEWLAEMRRNPQPANVGMRHMH